MKRLTAILILALLFQVFVAPLPLGATEPNIDLAITKIDNPDPVIVGDNLTYTIQIVNNGTDTACDVYVFDMYPTDSLTVQSTDPSKGTVGMSLPQWVLDTIEQELGIITLPPGYSYLTWEAGNLAPGVTANLTIVATVNPYIPLPEGSPIINRALVMANVEDSDWDDNYAESHTSIALPDISINPSLVNFGSVQVGFTSGPVEMTVSNTGDDDLILGTVTSNDTQFYVSGPGIDGQTLVPGASTSFNIVFKPASAGIKTGSLSITSNDPDENPATALLQGFGFYVLPPTTPTTATTTPIPTPTPDGLTPVTPRFFTVDFLGKITKEPASEDGRPLNDVEAFSPGDVHLLEIDSGTRASDSIGNSITTITIRETQAPELPENTALVGSALEFMPTGTSFDRDVTLTLGYNVEDLPEEIISIGTAYYEPGFGWRYVDTKSNVVAGIGELEATLNHFTVFAILARVPSETLINGQPETPTPEMTIPASFILSNLTIETSESKTWHGFTFVARYGEDAKITVDITNTGGESGVYEAILLLNGEPIQSVPFDIVAGETQQVVFNVNGNEPGDYTVRIGNLTGEFSSWVWINWWLISGMILVVILMGWGAFFFIRRRIRGY